MEIIRLSFMIRRLSRERDETPQAQKLQHEKPPLVKQSILLRRDSRLALPQTLYACSFFKAAYQFCVSTSAEISPLRRFQFPPKRKEKKWLGWLYGSSALHLRFFSSIFLLQLVRFDTKDS